MRQQNTRLRSARYRISGILPTVGRLATLHRKRHVGPARYSQFLSMAAQARNVEQPRVVK